MRKLLKNFFIPHETNNHHPHSLRHYSLFSYALIFLLANYLVFPLLGINNTRVLASNINTDELISFVNKERTQQGLNPLIKNDKLTNAALQKGNNMLKQQYWDHFGPNGETPWQFIKGSGYSYAFAGENLAKNFQTDLDAHLAWMNSKTHRENILNSNYHDIGMAVVDGELLGKKTTLIVQMFGTTENDLDKISLSNDKNKNIQVSKPISGSLFNTNNVEIQGVANTGETLQIYSNNKLIGELPRTSSAFTINTKLFEEKNTLIIKTNNNQESEKVSITIDTTNPVLDKLKVQIFKENRETYILVNSEEALSKVELIYNGTQTNFTQNNGYFLLKKNSDYFSNSNVQLKFYDVAGNTSQNNYDLNDKNLIVESAATLPVKLENRDENGLSGVIANLRAMSPIRKFDLAYMLFLCFIIAIDAVFVVKRKINRDHSKHNHFTFGILLFVITVSAFVL